MDKCKYCKRVKDDWMHSIYCSYRHAFDPTESDTNNDKSLAMAALESLTPGGSEFHEDITACVHWVLDRLSTNWGLAKTKIVEAEKWKVKADKLARALEEIDSGIRGDLPITAWIKEIIHAALAEYKKE